MTDTLIFKCKECGKEFPSKKSLGGHLWLMHRIRSGKLSQLKADIEEYKMRIANLEKQLQENKASMRKNTEVLEKQIKSLTEELQQTQKQLYCPACKRKWSEHKKETSFWDNTPYWVCPKH